MINSGTLSGGGSFTLRIDAPPGKYEYICLFHADDFNMKGTITVTP
jgi:plastocyanin